MFKLYRDDDISVTSDLGLLMKVHEQFIRYNRIHTVAVVMKDIWQNKEIWYWLMTARNLDVGLHGWEHRDYSRMDLIDIEGDITMSLEYWNHCRARGKYPHKQIEVFYPPWNKISPALQKACDEFSLALDNRVGGEVFNFHYWACTDRHMDQLQEALRCGF